VSYLNSHEEDCMKRVMSCLIAVVMTCCYSLPGYSLNDESKGNASGNGYTGRILTPSEKEQLIVLHASQPGEPLPVDLKDMKKIVEESLGVTVASEIEIKVVVFPQGSLKNNEIAFHLEGGKIVINRAKLAEMRDSFLLTAAVAHEIAEAALSTTEKIYEDPHKAALAAESTAIAMRGKTPKATKMVDGKRTNITMPAPRVFVQNASKIDNIRDGQVVAFMEISELENLTGEDKPKKGDIIVCDKDSKTKARNLGDVVVYTTDGIAAAANSVDFAIYANAIYELNRAAYMVGQTDGDDNINWTEAMQAWGKVLGIAEGFTADNVLQGAANIIIKTIPGAAAFKADAYPGLVREALKKLSYL